MWAVAGTRQHLTAEMGPGRGTTVAIDLTPTTAVNPIQAPSAGFRP